MTQHTYQQMRLTAPEASIHDVNNGEEFRFLPINPSSTQPVQWGVPVPVRIQHAKSAAFMAMDLNGRVYQTFNATGNKDALFALETVPSTNAFLISSLAYENMYLNFDADTGGLRGATAAVNVTDYRPDSSVGGTDYVSIAGAAAVKRRRMEEQGADDEKKEEGPGRSLPASAAAAGGGTQGSTGTGGGGNYALNGGPPSPGAPSASLAPALKYRSLPATAFMASQLVSPLMVQNLQISVAAFRSDTMESPRLCTMFIYDLTPNSDSYTCYEVQGDPTGLPLVEMEMAAWITQDKTNVLGPRSPLENGRTRCENSAPSETVTCNVAYGEGLTFQRELDVSFGQYYAYFFQFNEGSAARADTAWGGYYNFQVCCRVGVWMAGWPDAWWDGVSNYILISTPLSQPHLPPSSPKNKKTGGVHQHVHHAGHPLLHRDAQLGGGGARGPAVGRDGAVLDRNCRHPVQLAGHPQRAGLLRHLLHGALPLHGPVPHHALLPGRPLLLHLRHLRVSVPGGDHRHRGRRGGQQVPLRRAQLLERRRELRVARKRGGGSLCINLLCVYMCVCVSQRPYMYVD